MVEQFAHDVGDSCYSPAMGETKKAFPLRATPTWANMVKAQAARETRPAGNLIERVMIAYCSDPEIRDLVRRFEDTHSEG